MKFNVSAFMLAGTLFSSCATIVSQSRWPVAVSSSPAGAQVSIVDRNGKEVFAGPTPAAVKLKSGAGFFRKAIYTLNFTMPGYNPQTTTLEADINGWYFGNIFIGGVIGLLIVDPATGAMYRIAQRQVQVSLSQTQGFYLPQPEGESLQIVSISQIPEADRHLLIPIKPAGK